MQLSFSAIDKYRSCPAEYANHYIERLRSDRLGSALFFGSAVDEGLNILLLAKKPVLTDEEKETLKKLEDQKMTANDIFDYHFTYQTLKKDIGPEHIGTSTAPKYFKSDFDPDLLEDEDIEKLNTYIENAGYGEKDDRPDHIDLYEEIKELIWSGKKVDAANLSFFNYCSWLSLRRKGHLFIDAYREHIMPLIKVVHDIQRKVELPNDDDDIIIGYIDFEAEFVDEEGIYTIDNKTSSTKYKASDINDNVKKGQLLLYDEYTEHKKAAYIVLLKKLKKITHKTCQKCGAETTRGVKTCPEGGTGKKRCNGDFDLEYSIEVPWQIIKDDIDDDKKDLLFEEIDDIMTNIENKEFPQNREGDCFKYGSRCIYYNYCREGNAEGLSRKVNK